jgi:hypothetical protein
LFHRKLAKIAQTRDRNIGPWKREISPVWEKNYGNLFM